MINPQNALFFLALVAVLWSSGGVMIKSVAWPPLAIAGLRSLIAAAVIWLAFRKERLHFSRIQLAGAVAYCGMVTSFVTATKLTTAANAILLQYTAPIYVALLSGWLLREKVTRRDVLTIGVVFGGMIFFFLDKVSTGGMLGNILGIVSGISFALFVIFTRMQKDHAPFGSVLLGNILTFFLSLPVLPDITFTVFNLAIISVLGVFQLGLAYVIYSYAIRHVRALEATLITSIEPILNPIWVFLFLGEIPGPYSLIGGAIVLFAVIGGYFFDAYKSKIDTPAG
ncbi:DMT family transporter [Sporolituus thermophilus]|nr:EamA family transporter [Sporolituus thermophilus]